MYSLFDICIYTEDGEIGPIATDANEEQARAEIARFVDERIILPDGKYRARVTYPLSGDFEGQHLVVGPAGHYLKARIMFETFPRVRALSTRIFQLPPEKWEEAMEIIKIAEDSLEALENKTP